MATQRIFNFFMINLTTLALADYIHNTIPEDIEIF